MQEQTLFHQYCPPSPQQQLPSKLSLNWSFVAGSASPKNEKAVSPVKTPCVKRRISRSLTSSFHAYDNGRVVRVCKNVASKPIFLPAEIFTVVETAADLSRSADQSTKLHFACSEVAESYVLPVAHVRLRYICVSCHPSKT